MNKELQKILDMKNKLVGIISNCETGCGMANTKVSYNLENQEENNTKSNKTNRES